MLSNKFNHYIEKCLWDGASEWETNDCKWFLNKEEALQAEGESHVKY